LQKKTTTKTIPLQNRILGKALKYGETGARYGMDALAIPYGDYVVGEVSGITPSGYLLGDTSQTFKTPSESAYSFGKIVSTELVPFTVGAKSVNALFGIRSWMPKKGEVPTKIIKAAGKKQLLNQ